MSFPDFFPRVLSEIFTEVFFHGSLSVYYEFLYKFFRSFSEVISSNKQKPQKKSHKGIPQQFDKKLLQEYHQTYLQKSSRSYPRSLSKGLLRNLQGFPQELVVKSFAKSIFRNFQETLQEFQEVLIIYPGVSPEASTAGCSGVRPEIFRNFHVH